MGVPTQRSNTSDTAILSATKALARRQGATRVGRRMSKRTAARLEMPEGPALPFHKRRKRVDGEVQAEWQGEASTSQAPRKIGQLPAPEPPASHAF